uniref:Uncharacterized protein n=1 Tax=Brassica oleracea var. oleracea TaxID=109376 RepID=A0A0D3AZF6_BRAOL
MTVGGAAEDSPLDKEELRTRCDSSRTNSLERGCLQVPEEVLMTICTREQMEEIRRNSLSLMRSDITKPLVQSETDSFDEMDVFTPTRDG